MYGYDDTGLRISKTVNGVAHKYYYDGDLLIYEEYGDYMLIYIYDENGSPIGVKHRNKNFAAEQLETYLFGKNLQGDIIEIYNTSGTAVVKYVYDAWENIISTSGTQATGIGAKNSLRYRGYYYDTETGLYYLQSRYYDPVTGRFINADDRLSTGGDLSGVNLYAYCSNNPVNRIDPTGEAWWHWAIGAALVAACAVAVVVTAGGAAAGFAAVTMVANGCAAFSVSSTIAAGAFIGSSMAYTAAVIDASAESESLEDFAEKGNWGTIISTTISGAIGGYVGYEISKTQPPTTHMRGAQNPKVKAAAQRGQAMHMQMDYGPRSSKGGNHSSGLQSRWNRF